MSSAVATSGATASITVMYNTGASTYSRTILALSFDTSTLSGVVIDSVLARVYISNMISEDWALGIDLDVRSGCVSDPLVVTDSTCWASSDTLFSTGDLSIGWNYLHFRPTLVNTSGYTDLVMHAETSDQWDWVCEAGGINSLAFRMTEYAGQAYDPTLTVYGHTVAGEKRRWPQVTADDPDVYPLRKQLIHGDKE